MKLFGKPVSRARTALLAIAFAFSSSSVITYAQEESGQATAAAAQQNQVTQNSSDVRLNNRTVQTDFARLVVVGDSLSAGYQNGSLLDRLQVNGYASVVARQARTNLSLPLIAEPGVPNVLELVAPGPPPVVTPKPGISPGRTNPLEQPFNLAVPGARLSDLINARPTPPVDSLTDLVLGFPDLLLGRSRTQIEIAESLQPTTIFLWAGNNDALGAALNANPAFLTSQESFAADFRTVITRLAATNAKLVVANIPDVTVVAYLTPAKDALAIFGQTITTVGGRLGLADGDFVTPNAFPLIQQNLSSSNPVPLPGNVVLTAAETATIRTAVAEFNRTIAREAAAQGAALVDINRALNLIDRFGYPVVLRTSDGLRLKFLTTNFLGGIFSLDGVHPTNSGYAIVANEFIAAYDLRFRRLLLPVNVSRVAEDDPLVIKNANSTAANQALMPSNIDTDNLRTIFAPKQ